MTRAAPLALAALLLAGSLDPAAAQPAPPPWPAALPPVPPPPAAARAMEGTWRIVAPSATLTPVAGAVPFTADGRKQYEVNVASKAQGKFDDYDITTSRCSSPGVPRLMLTPTRFRLWLQQNVATFDFEWNRAIRQVDMRGVKHEQALVPNMIGVTTGRWEGDTLVATTTDVSDRTLIDALVPHSADMTVTERFRLIDRDTLEDRMTIEDPATFTNPWEAVLRFKRQPDAVFPEDICLDRLKAHQPIMPAS